MRKFIQQIIFVETLYITKLEEDGNMINRIINVLETTDKFKAIGEDINESHLSALLLCLLSSSYDTLVTAFEARSEEELNLEFIKGKLADKFQRRTENSDSSYEHKKKEI